MKFMSIPDVPCSDRVSGFGDGGIPKFVLDRLCMAEATMTCMSGADETVRLLQRCGNMIQQGECCAVASGAYNGCHTCGMGSAFMSV